MKEMNKVIFFGNSPSFKELHQYIRKQNLKSSLELGGLTALENYKEEGIDLFVIDLALPKEEAYLILDGLYKDFHFSECKVVVCISHRSQLKRFRSFAFGVHDYMSPLIEKEEFLSKIKSLIHPDKNTIQMKWDKQVTIQFEANLTHISESGCLMETKAKFHEGAECTLNCTLFHDIGSHQDILGSASFSTPSPTRLFVNQIDFKNMGDSYRDSLRKLIWKWKDV